MRYLTIFGVCIGYDNSLRETDHECDQERGHHLGSKKGFRFW